MSDKDFLHHIPLFANLSESDRCHLADHVQETPYGKGEYIFREGDPADWFHIVKEGTVKCVKSSPEGRDVTLKFLVPGDLFCCEAVVFDGSTHPGCAKVMDQAKILRIKKEAYYELLRRNPDIAFQIINYLGKRLKEAQENAKSFAFDRAEQRVASVLVNIAAKASSPDAEGLRLTVRLTRRDLADMAGLTVETATRVMSSFKHQGIVIGTAKRLLIKDLPKLKCLAQDTKKNIPLQVLG